MFFKENLKFFVNPNPLSKPQSFYSCAPVLPDCKDTKKFKLRNFYHLKIKKFLYHVSVDISSIFSAP